MEEDCSLLQEHLQQAIRQETVDKTIMDYWNGEKGSWVDQNIDKTVATNLQNRKHTSHSVKKSKRIPSNNNSGNQADALGYKKVINKLMTTYSK